MKLASRIKTAAIVIVITLVVWVVADRSVLRTGSEIAVDVVVNCDEAAYRVTVLDPADKVLHVKFTGPGSSVDRVMAQDPRVKWTYDLANDVAEKAVGMERYVLSPRDGFTRLANEHRVTVAETDPPQIAIRVDRVGRAAVRVELAPEDRAQVAHGVTIEPAEVRASATTAVLKKLADGQVWPVPKLNLRSRRLLAGELDSQTADLQPNIADIDVKFDPPRVTVSSLRLTEFRQERQITEKIPIQIVAPPGLLRKYELVRLDPADEISNLTIVGPRADVQSVAPKDIRAMLVLSASDKPNPTGSTPIPRPLAFWFPNHPRVTIAGNPPEVNFTLKERTAPVPE